MVNWQILFSVPQAFNKVVEKFEYTGLPIHVIAEIVISKRKGEKSKIPGNIYVYINNPGEDTYDIKIGFTKSDPYKRMHNTTRTSRTKIPQMVGFFHGIKDEEGVVQRHFSSLKLEDLGNTEQFRCRNLQPVIEYFREQVVKQGGHIEKQFLALKG